MAWGKRKKELKDEEYLDDEELQDEEDVQDEDEEYDDDYEDDYEDDYYDDEPRRNPLKGVVIALVILALLLGAVCALLYMRLQTAEGKVSELTTALSNTQTELSRAQAQVASAPAAPALPPATPAPMTTPAPTTAPAQETPAPTATPEPTPEPTATPAPLLKDAITNDMLGGAVRPQDANWFDTAKTGKVVNAWVLALHWGPGDGYYENLALNKDDVVEMLARENGWVLIRTANDQYRWANGYFLQEIEATPAPADGTI